MAYKKRPISAKKGDQPVFQHASDVRSFVRLYPVVAALLLVHIAAWLLFSLPLTALEPIWQYAVGTNGAIRHGEYWRLVSPIVLHRDFHHMAVNSLSLWLFGRWLEHALGKTKVFVSVYRRRNRRQCRHFIPSAAAVHPCRGVGRHFRLVWHVQLPLPIPPRLSRPPPRPVAAFGHGGSFAAWHHDTRWEFIGPSIWLRRRRPACPLLSIRPKWPSFYMPRLCKKRRLMRRNPPFLRPAAG